MAGGEDTGNRRYGEWMKADTHIRADDQRTNQHSPRRRRSELATQTDPSLKIASPTDVRHNLLFNYCNLLFLVFLCKKRYFRFR